MAAGDALALSASLGPSYVETDFLPDTQPDTDSQTPNRAVPPRLPSQPLGKAGWIFFGVGGLGLASADVTRARSLAALSYMRATLGGRLGRHNRRAEAQVFAGRCRVASTASAPCSALGAALLSPFHQFVTAAANIGCAMKVGAFADCYVTVSVALVTEHCTGSR